VTAWYNEPDPFAAAWLRNLIAAGHIAPGIVDERKIQDVEAWELLEFTQCHFFAGIGVWSHALRRAGWSDDRPIWTGSCPCQPFSAAGKQKGFEDDRHLWPEFRRLIATCRPAIVLGEQVASKDGLGWLDHVAWDLENISVWSALYENLHKVQKRAATGELPQVFGEIVRWATTSVQSMSAGIRENLEITKSGISPTGAIEACGKGQRIPEKIQRSAPRRDIGKSLRVESQTEKSSLRPSGLYPSDRIARAESAMRNDGNISQLGEESSKLEFSFDRSDRTRQGLRHVEYQDCVLCNEYGFGIVGRDSTEEDHDCLAGKEIANDPRRIADAFEMWLASKDGLGWLDLVSNDMEGAGYAFGASDLCAAGFGGAHLRQRLYFVGMGDGFDTRLEGHTGNVDRARGRTDQAGSASEASATIGLADSLPTGRSERGTVAGIGQTAGSGATIGLADTDQQQFDRGENIGQGRWIEPAIGNGGSEGTVRNSREAGSLDDADWLLCRNPAGEPSWRPVESSTFPLAHGIAGRVGRLRAYGNALDAKTATAFAEVVREISDDLRSVKEFDL
jgi:site-specific DNA-cytosine methylase